MTYDNEHYCKYFIYNVKADFEPTNFKDKDGNKLYKRVEYAYSGCSCGNALKVPTKAKTE